MATQTRSELQKAIITLSGQMWGPIRIAASEDLINLELTLPQIKVMGLLRKSGPMRMTDLATRLEVSLPTATGLIDRLMDKGCVVRTVNQDDRRVVMCDLSTKGRFISEDLGEIRTKKWGAILDQLNDDELAQVHEAFKIMAQKAQRLEKIPVSTSSR